MKHLYLEERIARVRAALNDEATYILLYNRDEDTRERLVRWMRQCIATLDGFGPEYGGLPGEEEER